MGCENSANDVLVDVDTEGQDNLLGNAWAVDCPASFQQRHESDLRLGLSVPASFCVLRKTEAGIFDEPERDEG